METQVSAGGQEDGGKLEIRQGRNVRNVIRILNRQPKIRIPLGEPTELVAASQCDLVDHELDFEHEQGGFELGVKTLCKDVGGLEF